MVATPRQIKAPATQTPFALPKLSPVKKESNDEVAPPEAKGSLLVGCFVYFLPIILLVVMDPFVAGKGPLAHIVSGLLNLAIVAGVVIPIERNNPAVEMGRVPLKDLFKSSFDLLFNSVFPLGTPVTFLVWYGLHALVPVSTIPESGPRDSWLWVFAVLLATDFNYYFYHRYVAHGRYNPDHPWIVRKLHMLIGRGHREHHALEFLDIARGNFGNWFDAGVISLPIPMAIFAWSMGVSAHVLFYASVLILSLESTHHANCTFNIGPLAYIFSDGTGHKIHHLHGGEHLNIGLIFSLWDQMFGTYYEDQTRCTNWLHFNKRKLQIQNNLYKGFWSSILHSLEKAN